MVLLRYRHIQGKNIKFITNELIKRFIPFLTLKSFMLSEETIQFREKLYNTYMEKVMAELENENITKIINL